MGRSGYRKQDISSGWPYGVHTALSMASYITVWAGCSTESHSIKVTSTLAPVGV